MRLVGLRGCLKVCSPLLRVRTPTHPAVRGPADVDHLVEGEEEPRRVADAEDEDDAHEDDGEVVLLLAPHRRLRVGP